ncbi:MAG: hypothetical protein ACI318_06520 [Bacilli bacterium]
MKKSKILLCLGLGALLSSTALMASPKQNELELKGLNVEKVVGVKKASESPIRTLSVHFKLDKGSYEGLYAYMWGETSGTNAMIEYTSSNSFLDGYGITLNVDLTKAEYGFNEETSFGIILKYGKDGWNKIGGNRMFTVPETFDNGVYDVYTYNSDASLSTKNDGPGKNYLQWMARNNIEKLSTKAQLQYTFEKTGEDYSFSNMKINFGALIKKEHIDNLVASGVDIKNVAVGVFKKTDLDADVGENAKGAVWNKKGYVTTSEAAFNYSELVANGTTDETGTSSTGDYLMFSADLKYPAGSSYYTEEVYAVAYIDIGEGENRGAAMLNAKLCSVSSLADEYIASSEFTTFSASIQASLQALGALND